MDSEFIENKDSPEDIKNYFIQGIDTEDIIPLWHLTQKQFLLDAFVTLFRGTKSDILIRIFILSEMVSKIDPPSWSMTELRHAFSCLTDTALDTVIKRGNVKNFMKHSCRQVGTKGNDMREHLLQLKLSFPPRVKHGVNCGGNPVPYIVPRSPLTT